MKAFALILALVALSGCVATAPTRSEVISQKSDECSAYGYEEGTPAHTQCVHVSVVNRDRARAARKQDASDALIRMGMYYSTPAAYRRSITVW